MRNHPASRTPSSQSSNQPSELHSVSQLKVSHSVSHQTSHSNSIQPSIQPSGRSLASQQASRQTGRQAGSHSNSRQLKSFSYVVHYCDCHVVSISQSQPPFSSDILLLESASSRDGCNGVSPLTRDFRLGLRHAHPLTWHISVHPGASCHISAHLSLSKI